MQLIRPNCRTRLTAADIDFILSVLAPEGGASACLTHLLTEADTRDMILDQEDLLHALLEKPCVLNISPHFYFYVLTRHILKRAGIEDREVADYLAELLAEYSSAARVYRPLPEQTCSMERLADLMLSLQALGEKEQFGMRAHLGNMALFWSGLFLKRIQHCEQCRAAPNVAYYESIGSLNFKLAGDHYLADKYNLSPVLLTLSRTFHETRLALNALSERLVTLGDPFASVADVLAPAPASA